MSKNLKYKFLRIFWIAIEFFAPMELDLKTDEKQNESNSNMKSKRDQYTTEIRKKKTEATLNAKRMRYANLKDNDTFQIKINTMTHNEVYSLTRWYSL